jgi:WD40 repeat protein
LAQTWSVTGDLLWRVPYGSGGAFCSLDLSANGHFIALSQEQKDVSFWDIQSNYHIHKAGTLSTAEEVFRIAISPDSQYIAAGCTNGDIYV